MVPAVGTRKNAAEKRYGAITPSGRARSPSYPLNYPCSNIRNERHESSTLVKHVRGALPRSYVVTRGGKTSPGSWEHRLAGWLGTRERMLPPNTFNGAQHTCFNVRRLRRACQSDMTSGLSSCWREHSLYAIPHQFFFNILSWHSYRIMYKNGMRLYYNLSKFR